MNTPEHDVRELDERGAPPAGAAARRAYPPDDPLAGVGRRAEEWAHKAYYPEDPRRKSPALAMILSLMPGLGQIYVGYYQLGFTNILVVATVITLLSNSGHIGLNALEPLLGVFLAFFWLYNLVDAGRRASFYNQALAGLDPAAVPKDMQLPSGGGAMAGGVVLLVLGLIIFSHTMFGFSLDWLERWWPLGLIAGGAYLIYLGVKDKARRAAAAAPEQQG